MRHLLLASVILAAGACSNDTTHTASTHPSAAIRSESPIARAARTQMPAIRIGGIASLPDHGGLVAFDPAPPIHRSAYTFRRVDVSEAHALSAIATGTMVLPRADGGAPIKLQYVRHVEHDNGNWTWVGRPEGANPGTEAIITFGDKAVFGTIPSGDDAPMRLTMDHGHVILVETNGAREIALAGAHPKGPDALPLPVQRLRRIGPAPASIEPHALGTDMAEAFHLTADAISAQNASASPANTIDLVLGYTTAFASRLGGQSQATTRLTYLVDVGNQALANSLINGQLRMVKSVQVNYPDATDNSQALYDLSGFECDSSGCLDRTVPAALMPLITARETYGADLVVLVRTFQEPENQGCGIAWLIGGGQVPITSDDAFAAMAVVGDSNGTLYNDGGYYCPDESMIHEVGHNLGSAHDRATAAGDDAVLQEDEYGVFPYSFGHRTDANNGSFHTIMAYGGSTQFSYRVFSNPRITYCGGRACGVTDQADNARSIGQTLPTVATFRAMVAKFGDVNGEYWAYDEIRRLANAGITNGCAAATATSLAMYCPESSVTREQMAAFLVRAQHGAAFVPPAATGVFADVPTSNPLAPYIEQLARDGVTNGCATNPARFCPGDTVLRDQMAVFLVRSRYGPTYTPPGMWGMFADVPFGYWAGIYIEKLANDGVTGGCNVNPPMYCPGNTVTRAQMAVFLVRSYAL